MWLVWEYEGESHLTRLRGVLQKASVFVIEELDDLPEQTEELGLDKWQRDEREREEQERLEEAELEQERRELEQEEEEAMLAECDRQGQTEG